MAFSQITWLATQGGTSDDLWYIDPAQLPFYRVSDGGGVAYYMATSISTVRLLTRAADDPDYGTCATTNSIEFVRQYALNVWGTSEEHADRAAVRAHEGPNYIQYTMGEIIYGATLDAVETTVPGENVVDPYLLVSCDVPNPTAMAAADVATLVTACID